MLRPAVDVENQASSRSASVNELPFAEARTPARRSFPADAEAGVNSGAPDSPRGAVPDPKAIVPPAPDWPIASDCGPVSPDASPAEGAGESSSIGQQAFGPHSNVSVMSMGRICSSARETTLRTSDAVTVTFELRPTNLTGHPLT